MSIECLDKFVIYVAGKTTSWISLILFPALLYSHLLDVELRHNVLDLSNTIPCLAILSPLGC